jgi:hypothetical protein
MNEEQEKSLSWADLLTRTYRLYRDWFWLLFRLALLPAIAAYFFSFMMRVFVRPALREFMPFPFGLHDNPYRYWAFWDTVRFAEGGIYWLISAFFFAAVAAPLVADEADTSPLADGFSKARRRLGAVVAVCLLSWTSFYVSALIGKYAVWRIVDHLHFGTISETVLFALPSVLIAGLLSRLGLAIPDLMNNPEISVSQAIRNSLKKTENWEPFFMVFLIKSAILGYSAYWLANRGLYWLGGHGILTAAFDPWVSRLVYICIAAALESPLFIAFTLLYRESPINQEAAPPAPVG